MALLLLRWTWTKASDPGLECSDRDVIMKKTHAWNSYNSCIIIDTRSWSFPLQCTINCRTKCIFRVRNINLSWSTGDVRFKNSILRTTLTVEATRLLVAGCSSPAWAVRSSRWRGLTLNRIISDACDGLSFCARVFACTKSRWFLG